MKVDTDTNTEAVAKRIYEKMEIHHLVVISDINIAMSIIEIMQRIYREKCLDERGRVKRSRSHYDICNNTLGPSFRYLIRKGEVHLWRTA